MSTFAKVFMLAGAVFVCLYCSGCATILGGIIGYQSGEMWAGAAIGAALDFGGDIADGLGQMLTDKETRFEQKVSLDSEQGTIELAKSDFSMEKVEDMMRSLEGRFEQNGWSYSFVEKKVSTGRILLSERWKCKDAAGGEFELNLLQEKCKPAKISIEQVGETPINRGVITIQIYEWLKKGALAEP
jgi:hypothetical protein